MTDSEIMAKLAEKGLDHVYRVRNFTAHLDQRRIKIELRCTEDRSIPLPFRCGAVVASEDGCVLEVEYGESEAVALSHIKWNLVRTMLQGSGDHLKETAPDLPTTLLLLRDEKDERH